MQKQHTARLKASLQRLTTELASGKVADKRAATGGNFSVIASLQHQLGALGAYRTAASEAGFYAGTLQTALGHVQESMSEIGPLLLEAADSDHGPWLTAASADARARLNTVVSSLNVNVAGQSLLGGTATGTAALADPDTILAGLLTAVAGQTTAAGVEAQIDAWFDTAGGGYDTTAYLGSTTGRAPFRIGPNETVSLDVTAGDARLREVLKGYAMASLVNEGALSGDRAEQAALMRSAGERMLTAQAGFSNLRADVGAAEASIDAATARNASETSALEIALSDIVAADPYDTAVDLEAAQLQLEALYAVTARLSRLTLTEYLR